MGEIIRYLICGGLTTVVSLCSFFVSTLIIGSSNTMQLQISNIISFVCAVVFAYILSRKWVFNDSKKSIGKEFAQFISCRTFALLIDMSIMQLMVFTLGFSDMFAKFCVQVIVTILNYVLSKKVIFTKENNNGEAT